MKKIIRLKVTILSLFLALSSFAQQNMNIEISPNFRSLSGIQNQEGRKIKEGIIYRSGNFAKLTESDVAKFYAMKITTIVDFRSDNEIQKDPDFIPVGQKIETKRALIGSINEKEMGQFMKVLISPKFSEAALDSLMIGVSDGFTNHIKDFKPFFDEIAKDESVVLFHCTAGKDRTGLASALFLHILDVSDQEIMKDYLRSNEAIQNIDLNKYKEYGLPKERMAKLMGVKPIYLETSWNNIIKKYGSIDKMLLVEFGIDKKIKNEIKKKYLIK
ncbi:tyrosine-protein phosphatase [Flavobacterium sp. LB1P62]|uniref:tyrosine-protein phosphatase n=1 Tax=unclassified Flavobacterium TaxID=196869 RepID=UPI003AB07011